MLSWMIVLKELAPDSQNPLEEGEIVLRTLSNLIKTTADQEKTREAVQQWLKREQ
jgi:hypothetical protein